MPLEPQSGRCSRGIVNIYHWYKKYKNLHKTEFLQNRKVKSNIFLYLKGFKSMSPIKGAVTMRPPMGRMDCRETGIVKPCIIVYKTTHIFYIKQLLLNTEAESQEFRPSLYFLSCILFPSSLFLPTLSTMTIFIRSRETQRCHADNGAESVSLISKANTALTTWDTSIFRRFL